MNAQQSASESLSSCDGSHESVFYNFVPIELYRSMSTFCETEKNDFLDLPDENVLRCFIDGN